MSGGANDRLALTEEERTELDELVAAALNTQSSEPGVMTAEEEMLIRVYQHIGVLDNRIANLSQQYRVIEKAAETLAARAWDEGSTAQFPASNPYRSTAGR
ncbi:hypothetical protein CH302_19415 [Rhodococcus sp. 15-2388-1-1a]|uniref:hypothetical protein n=1 Tax=Nocardiaceae TaxID=85025 RepID=UPI000568A0A0|nr:MULTISPECIES: hypothetical protein [Rhodococcus]OZE95111.1 hypothetical protein CH302_19415 [Rhodococcus sp. 15-2388-1-1a]